MTLDQVALDAPARITGFRGLAEADRSRLSAHGLRPGAEVVKLLATPLQDPVECLVGGQLLTLDLLLMSLIEVETP